MSNNLLKNLDDLKYFKNEDISFTLSSRMLHHGMDITEYIKTFYSYLNISQVESLFGFVNDFSPLYGGRGFNEKYTMDENHIAQMNDHAIGVSLTLTNHYFNEEVYHKSIPILQKHHKQGNSVVCVNDELALRIKKDFPLYVLKASLIKDLNSFEKVKKALDIYDLVVIPMEMNDDDEFLISLPNKERIILFANANCAYNCTSRICYSAISKDFIGKESPLQNCSKDILLRDQLGHVLFDIEKLHNFGFKRFKLVPDMGIKSELDERENTKTLLLEIMKKFKKVFYLFSFPKSGRTWLRYILANYINEYYKLGLEVNLHTMFTLIPNDDMDIQKGLSSYRYVKDTRFPLLVAFHKVLKPYSEGSNIVLLRNTYDLLVSEYFQHVYLLKRFEGSIKEFIRQKNGSLYGYCSFVNSLEFTTTNLLVITYEMMSKDITLVVKEVLTYLEIEIDEAILDKSIEQSSFENMRKDEVKRGIPGYKGDQNNPESLRMREGKVDHYSKYLDKDDIAYIKSYCESNLTSYSRELLKRLDIDFNKGAV